MLFKRLLAAAAVPVGAPLPRAAQPAPTAAPASATVIPLAAPVGKLVRRAPAKPGEMGRTASGQPKIPKGFVKGLLDAQDRNPEEVRMGGGNDGLVHVSSLVDACARREVLADMFPEKKFRSVHGGDRLVWAYGRAFEAHARSQFIRGWSGKLHGKWECRCGHKSFVGIKPHADHTCERCRHPMEVYKEHPISNRDLGVIGNCDLPALLEDNWLMIGEFKSMEGEAWKALEAPLGDHVVQAATYRKLYQLAGWRVVDTVAIIYGSKHYRFGSPYKEFHVDGTSLSVQNGVNEVLEAAAEVKRHREAKTLPPRTCSSQGITRSKQCAACVECWNLSA